MKEEKEIKKEVSNKDKNKDKEEKVTKEKVTEEKVSSYTGPSNDQDNNPVVSNIVLKNTSGEDVKEEDYFFGGKALSSFNTICGYPVLREDLLEIFNDIFDPKLNFLFYKTTNKEVYVIIIPIKNSSIIGKFNDSIQGDFQRHAISFVGEGSVNLETLKIKLKRIEPFVKNIKK